MASGINKVILIGNLGADPEVKYTPSGAAVCELRLATNESWTDKGGERQDRTEWHKVVVWGKTAENCGKYLAKGRPVYVEGKLRTESWEDKDGNKRYTTKIQAHTVQFLGGGREGGGRGGDDGAPPADVPTAGYADKVPTGGYGGAYGGPDDDIPF